MQIIAVDLGGTKTKAGIVKNSKLIGRNEFTAKSSGSLLSYLSFVKRNLLLLCEKSNTDPADLNGIGIASTGIIDNKKNRVLSVNKKYPDATQIDFSQWADEELGLPLILENDANAAMLGEWRYGEAKSTDNCIMLTLGTGIGSSVICNGHPLRGKHFQAGILGGHFIVNYNGRKCTCRGKGCVEAEASTWALPDIVRNDPEFNKSILSNLPVIDYKELFSAAEKKDKLSVKIRDNSMLVWAACTVSLIHAYDPEIVVFGGGIMKSAHIILPYITSYVEKHAWVKKGQVKIVKAKHIEDAALFGLYSLFCKQPEYI